MSVRFQVLALLALSLFLASAGGRTGSSAFAQVEVQSETLSAGELNERGVESYRRADYPAARASWLQALETPSELDRAVLHFNLGNTAYRMEQAPEALAWYENALRVRPRFAAARTNLEFLRSELGLEPDDRGDLPSTFRSLFGTWTLAETQWMALVAVLLCALAMFYEAWRGGATGRWLRWVSLGLLALALIPWCWQLRHSSVMPVMVIASDGSDLLSEPRGSAAVLRSLDLAEELSGVDRIPGWIRVQTADEQLGWVEQDHLFALETATR